MIYPLLETLPGPAIGSASTLNSQIPGAPSSPLPARSSCTPGCRSLWTSGSAACSGMLRPQTATMSSMLLPPAEWGWNSRGRSPREFSEAYAQRAGIPHPERFGEWADLMGQVGWDLAGGRAIQRLILPDQALFAEGQYRGSHQLKDLQPMQFGQGFLSEIPSSQYFEARMASSRSGARCSRKQKGMSAWWTNPGASSARCVCLRASWNCRMPGICRKRRRGCHRGACEDRHRRAGADQFRVPLGHDGEPSPAARSSLAPARHG